MYQFRSNPPARLIPPRPALLPSVGYLRRTTAASSRLEALERFCLSRDLAPGAVGRAVANDSRLIFDMRDGRIPRGRTLATIDAFLARQEGADA